MHWRCQPPLVYGFSPHDPQEPVSVSRTVLLVQTTAIHETKTFQGLQVTRLELLLLRYGGSSPKRLALFQAGQVGIPKDLQVAPGLFLHDANQCIEDLLTTCDVASCNREGREHFLQNNDSIVDVHEFASL